MTKEIKNEIKVAVKVLSGDAKAAVASALENAYEDLTEGEVVTSEVLNAIFYSAEYIARIEDGAEDELDAIFDAEENKFREDIREVLGGVILEIVDGKPTAYYDNYASYNEPYPIAEFIANNAAKLNEYNNPETKKTVNKILTDIA